MPVLSAGNCSASQKEQDGSLLQDCSMRGNARSVPNELRFWAKQTGFCLVNVSKLSLEVAHLCDQRTFDLVIPKLLKSGTANSLKLVDFHLLLLHHCRLTQRLASGQAGTCSCRIRRSTSPHRGKSSRFDRTQLQGLERTAKRSMCCSSPREAPCRGCALRKT